MVKSIKWLKKVQEMSEARMDRTEEKIAAVLTGLQDNQRRRNFGDSDGGGSEMA